MSPIEEAISKVLAEADPMEIRGAADEYDAEAKYLAKRYSGCWDNIPTGNRPLDSYDLKDCFDYWFWIDALDTKTAHYLADLCNEAINKVTQERR